MESSDIATSGRGSTAWPALELLGVAADTPMITRDMVAHAKPLTVPFPAHGAC
jgi:hypothetical protein